MKSDFNEARRARESWEAHQREMLSKKFSNIQDTGTQHE
jgi:hypothetical protein